MFLVCLLECFLISIKCCKSWFLEDFIYLFIYFAECQLLKQRCFSNKRKVNSTQMLKYLKLLNVFTLDHATNVSAIRVMTLIMMVFTILIFCHMLLTSKQLLETGWFLNFVICNMFLRFLLV